MINITRNANVAYQSAKESNQPFTLVHLFLDKTKFNVAQEEKIDYFTLSKPSKTSPMDIKEKRPFKDKPETLYAVIGFLNFVPTGSIRLLPEEWENIKNKLMFPRLADLVLTDL